MNDQGVGQEGDNKLKSTQRFDQFVTALSQTFRSRETGCSFIFFKDFCGNNLNPVEDLEFQMEMPSYKALGK